MSSNENEDIKSTLDKIIEVLNKNKESITEDNITINIYNPLKKYIGIGDLPDEQLNIFEKIKYVIELIHTNTKHNNIITKLLVHILFLLYYIYYHLYIYKGLHEK